MLTGYMPILNQLMCLRLLLRLSERPAFPGMGAGPIQNPKINAVRDTKKFLGTSKGFGFTKLNEVRAAVMGTFACLPPYELDRPLMPGPSGPPSATLLLSSTALLAVVVPCAFHFSPRRPCQQRANVRLPVWCRCMSGRVAQLGFLGRRHRREGHRCVSVYLVR